MTEQRWRRLLPEGRHLLLVASLAALALAVVGFISLYQIKVEALAERSMAQTQVRQLLDQNQQLRDALARAQRGDNVEPQARRYFKMGRPGDKLILAQSVATPDPQSSRVPFSGSEAGNPPYWRLWLEQLLHP